MRGRLPSGVDALDSLTCGVLPTEHRASLDLVSMEDPSPGGVTWSRGGVE